MKKRLHVFDKVPIPVDLASTQTYALLARREGGKTYTTLLFEEQLCDAGLYFVTLDPVGKHWAIRAGADGSPDGGKGDVFVLGGLHGDVPLEPTAGTLIADVVVDHPGRYVLDTTLFDTEADQDRFATAFGQRLIRRKLKDPSWPLTVIMEEAENFIPEKYNAGQAKMLGTYGKIMRQGRNYGLGLWIVAQRSQALNKGVLSQAEVLIVKQMSHNRDIDAVRAWITANGKPEQEREMLSTLAHLGREEAWVWSPSWLDAFTRTRVPRRVTFDSSASVKGGQTAVDVELTPLDVHALGEQIAATAERAKAEDPKELHRRIRELEAELARKPQTSEPEQIEVPVWPFSAEELDRAIGCAESILQSAEQSRETLYASLDALRDLQGSHDRTVEIALEADNVLRPLKAWRERRDGHPTARPAATQPTPPAPPPAAPARGEPRGARGPVAHSNGNLSGPQQRILDALAWLEAVGFSQPSKIQVGFIAGYRVGKKVGGNFGNVLGQLRGLELIHYPTPGAVELTHEGRRYATVPDIERSSEGLQNAVYERLTEPERRVLEPLVRIYPQRMRKQEIGAEAGYAVGEKVGGNFGNILGRLRTLGLIEYPVQGYAAAADVLFLSGR